MKLLTTKQVANQIEFSERTLRRWRCQGYGPDFLTIGRNVRYHPNDVQKWLDQYQACGSTAEARYHNAS